MILNFLISIFGQILQLSIAKKWQHHIEARYIKQILVFHWIVIFLTLKMPTHLFVLFQLSTLTLFPIVKIMLLIQKNKWLTSNTLELIDALSLDIKSGISIQQAIKNLSENSPDFFSLQIEKFLLKRSLSQKIDRSFLFYSFFAKLESIQASSGRCIEQVEYWRAQEKTQRSLTRKLQAGLSQVRAQTWVLIFMLFALSLFYWKETTDPQLKLFVFTILWSAIGAFLLVKMSRLPQSQHLQLLQLAQQLRLTAIMGLSIKHSLFQCREHFKDHESLIKFIDSSLSESPPTSKDATVRQFEKLIRKGLSGEPVLGSLAHIETELFEKGMSSIEIRVNRLPVYGLIPLFVFFLPSYLVLILSPLLNSALII